MGNLVTYPFPYLYKKKQEWQEEKYVKSIFTLDIKKMKEIWSIVERDSMYYGFALCTMIFKTHPEYVKYFEDTSLPYFVQEAKLKKKFRNICEMLCALFLNYDNTSMKNDFLGYIAMVHKDMGLTVFDFENFTSDLLDMLIQELPHMMTKDYIIAQKICYNDVCSLMIKFINRNTKKILEMQNAHTSKKCFKGEIDPMSQIFYGHPLSYWEDRKEYWNDKRDLWISLESDIINFNYHNVLKDERYSINDKKSRRKQLKKKLSKKETRYESDNNDDYVMKTIQQISLEDAIKKVIKMTPRERKRMHNKHT